MAPPSALICARAAECPFEQCSNIYSLFSLVTTHTRTLWSYDPMTQRPSLSGDQSNAAQRASRRCHAVERHRRAELSQRANATPARRAGEVGGQQARTCYWLRRERLALRGRRAAVTHGKSKHTPRTDTPRRTCSSVTLPMTPFMWPSWSFTLLWLGYPYLHEGSASDQDCTQKCQCRTARGLTSTS